MGKRVTIKKPPWDLGQTTLAARVNLVEEDAIEIDPETGKRSNPNNARRMRRVSFCEIYYKKGQLSKDQFHAAMALQEAWERTQRTAPAIKEINVDSSPKPDANIDILIDRIGSYHKFRRHVQSKYWAYVDHVVLDNRAISSMAGGKSRQYKYLERLALGLEDLAEAMK